MTGLADAYTDDVGALQSPLRLKAGVGLLAAGALLAVAALAAVVLDPSDYGTRRVAGLLGGLAAPALVGGVVVILPASPRLRAAGAIGASVTLLGVASFWHAYPQDWAGYGADHTGLVTTIYFLGMLTLVCCCFAGIATLKRRNDPGGTVSLQVGEGETRIVKVRERVGGIGGVGLLGGTPEGDVETQTNRPDRAATTDEDGASVSLSGGSAASSTGSSATSAGPGVTGASATDGAGRERQPGTYGTSDDAGAFGGGTAGSGAGGSGSAASGATGYESGGLGTSDVDDGPSDVGTGFDSSPTASGGSSDATGAVSDGGATSEPLRDVEPAGDAGARGGPDLADRYCGNCEHFQYARTEQGMTPYCALAAEYMDDMEACSDWSSNAGP